MRPLFKLLFCLLIFSGSSIFADLNTSLEFRGAAFIHSSHRFREIYGNIGSSYQIEAAGTLDCNFDCNLGWFANADWTQKKGRSEGLNDVTKMSIANFSFGLKYLYPFFCNYTAYVGIGPSFSRIALNNHHTHHRSHHNRYNSRIAIGGILKTGVLYSIRCNIFLDVFVDYLYQPVSYSTSVNIGGFKTGAGIGYKF